MDAGFCFRLPGSYYIADVQHLVLWNGDGHILGVESEDQTYHILGSGAGLVLCVCQSHVMESCPYLLKWVVASALIGGRHPPKIVNVVQYLEALLAEMLCHQAGDILTQCGSPVPNVRLTSWPSMVKHMSGQSVGFRGSCR